MSIRGLLISVIILFASPLSSAPAPWYKWQSKVDGKVFCAQSSPGGGWQRLTGSYQDLRCQKPVRESIEKPRLRFDLD